MILTETLLLCVPALALYNVPLRLVPPVRDFKIISSYDFSEQCIIILWQKGII